MEIKRIRDHLFSIEEGFVRCFLMEGTKKALVVDAVCGSGTARRVENQTSKPLTLCLTHSDPDHTAACAEFEDICFIPRKWRFAQKQRYAGRV